MKFDPRVNTEIGDLQVGEALPHSNPKTYACTCTRCGAKQDRTIYALKAPVVRCLACNQRRRPRGDNSKPEEVKQTVVLLVSCGDLLAPVYGGTLEQALDRIPIPYVAGLTNRGLRILAKDGLYWPLEFDLLAFKEAYGMRRLSEAREYPRMTLAPMDGTSTPSTAAISVPTPTSAPTKASQEQPPERDKYWVIPAYDWTWFDPNNTNQDPTRAPEHVSDIYEDVEQESNGRDYLFSSSRKNADFLFLYVTFTLPEGSFTPVKDVPSITLGDVPIEDSP